MEGHSALIRVLPTIAFIPLFHAAMLQDKPVLGLFAIFALCLLMFAVKRLTDGHWRGSLGWFFLALIISATIVTTMSGGSDLSWIIVLPPIVVNTGLLYLFGRTILPGREPLITRFRRLCDGGLTPEIRRYTRRWTVFWVIFLGFSTAASLLASLYADWTTWSWIVNIACPASVATAFLAEHLYRRRYLSHFGPTSVIRTLRTILRPESWSLSSAAQ